MVLDVVSANLPNCLGETSSPSRSRQALAPLYKPTKPRFLTIHIAERFGVPSTVFATSPCTCNLILTISSGFVKICMNPVNV